MESDISDISKIKCQKNIKKTEVLSWIITRQRSFMIV